VGDNPGGVGRYRGIRYGTAVRFRAPVPIAPANGMVPAQEFGPVSPQQGRRYAPQSEDCLYLNIWTPGGARAAALPVMVWIHGGAFANGMGSSPTYAGERLAREGVIVVTLNYRLGVFGFLAHPALTAESEHKSSGNYGLEDQLFALKWVAANIAKFGGDPENVTIFGQSAGGASVIDLISSPQARGLFGRAIVQSGAARDGIRVPAVSAAEQQGRAFAGDQGFAALRRLSQEAVVERAERLASSGLRFGPVIDGYLLTRAPLSALGEAGRSGIELLVGSNSREGLAVIAPDQLPQQIRTTFGPNADRALAIYGLANGATGSVDPLLGSDDGALASAAASGAAS